MYITGSFYGTANFNTPSATGSNENTAAGSGSVSDIFVAKYDDTGTFQWAKRAGSASFDQANGIAVSGTNVYITGYITNTANFNTPSAAGSNEISSAGGNDIFLAKYDDTGAFQWAKRAGAPLPVGSNEQALGVAVSGNAVYITGIMNGTTNFNTPSSSTSNTLVSAGSLDIFLAKYDDTGAFQWARRAGGTGVDYSNAIAVSGTNVYITGYFKATANFNTPSNTTSNTLVSAGGEDIFLAKYDDTGALLQIERAGKTGFDNGYSIMVSGSTVYLAGLINGTSGFIANNLICTPSVSIAASPSHIITAGTSVTFTATSTNSGTSTYQWEKNNVIVGTNSATYTDATLVNDDVIKCVLTSTEFCSFNVQATSSDLRMSVSGVLPVELLGFNGKYTEGGNLLTWQTANEVNNKGFQIERLMENGGWAILGFVKGYNQASTYQFTDTAPLSTSYYRLRQIDNDGTETVSKVISISSKGNSTLKVYPNPVFNVLIVEATQTSDYQVFNLLGQQVLNGKTPPLGVGGLDVSALPQGSYVLKVGTEQAKFIKQ